MKSQPQVLMDLSEFRTQLHESGSAHHGLLRVGPARPLIDIAFDWLTVLVCVWGVGQWGFWLAPLAVCVIANRQRALGNILHDAGHRNLCRNRHVNDIIASALVAPLAFASLQGYRSQHFQHHLALGDARFDPDFLMAASEGPVRWRSSYWMKLTARGAWRSSFLGDLVAEHVAQRDKLYIVGWWVLALAALASMAGATFAALFVLLWLAARATVFHLITTLREMCDHFGLQTGGIFSYTRDMACHGMWRWIVHPRNNGYHLTHHLLPAVPYYRLPQAHRLFREMPVFKCRGQVRDGYFAGNGAVVRDWTQGVTP